MNLSEVQIPPLRNSSWRSRFYGRNDKIEGVVTAVGMTKRTESLLRKEGQHRRCNNGILWDKASAIQLKGLLYLANGNKKNERVHGIKYPHGNYLPGIKADG